MDIYHIIKRPLITEKGTHQSSVTHEETRWKVARGGSYAFEVHPEASKPMIRAAIERIYNVKVLNVRTAVRHGKRRRYRFTYGNQPDWKRAVVVLEPGFHIDLF
ncbi:MAG: 50S ribosomal protein L23 [Phycisphaerae bacterium]|nr:50S ribosomal protein L23 [Phycisphaerae bacterium]